MKTFNLNDYILVKLTDAGKKIYLESLQPPWKVYGQPAVALPPSNDGYFRFQAWHFMQTFGSKIYMGMNPELFDMNIRFVEEPELNADKETKSFKLEISGLRESLIKCHAHIGEDVYTIATRADVVSRDAIITADKVKEEREKI